MGNYAYHAHLSDGLFDFFKKWLSRIPGNLACATIAACAGGGAICGSTPATCAGMGAVALPEMRKENYDDKLSTGAIAFGGTLGIMIPPSTPMIPSRGGTVPPSLCAGMENRSFASGRGNGSGFGSPARWVL